MKNIDLWWNNFKTRRVTREELQLLSSVPLFFFLPLTVHCLLALSEAEGPLTELVAWPDHRLDRKFTRCRTLAVSYLMFKPILLAVVTIIVRPLSFTPSPSHLWTQCSIALRTFWKLFVFVHVTPRSGIAFTMGNTYQPFICARLRNYFLFWLYLNFSQIYFHRFVICHK